MYVCVPYVLSVLDPEDLLPEVLKVVEGGLGGDGVDQSKALAILHVEVPHRRELLLRVTQVHRGTVRQVGEQVGRPTDRQTVGQSDRQSVRWWDRQAERQIDRWTGGQTDGLVRQFLPSLPCPGSPTCTAARPPPLAKTRQTDRTKSQSEQLAGCSLLKHFLPQVCSLFF